MLSWKAFCVSIGTCPIGGQSPHIQVMLQRSHDPSLPPIPVLDAGESFPLETLQAELERAHALIDSATRHVPKSALQALDAVSRRWLKKWNVPALDEIDAIATFLGRPGAYFLAVNYEWGCTCRVAPSADGRSARLLRVLDWRTPGLGRYVIAARVRAHAGPFVALTWPGYTGVLQGMAPGRFSAALNQAPMRSPIGFYPLDWAANKAQVWRMPHMLPANLLRRAFVEAENFGDARQMLMDRPIAAPAIYVLAGTRPDELCVVERTETEARVHDGENVATNHWQAGDWHGRPRGVDSAGRACRMWLADTDIDAEFPWLKPPILNDKTRLAMIGGAAQGRFVAQGFERDGPATAVLDYAA